MTIYMSKDEYQTRFKPTYIEGDTTNPLVEWVREHTTVVVLDFLPPHVKESLYVQDTSYLEALTSDGEVIRKIGYDTMIEWLLRLDDNNAEA
jgi:hypothetical protein